MPPKKKKHCTSCFRPCRGHLGPTGKNCVFADSFRANQGFAPPVPPQQRNSRRQPIAHGGARPKTPTSVMSDEAAAAVTSAPAEMTTTTSIAGQAQAPPAQSTEEVVERLLPIHTSAPNSTVPAETTTPQSVNNNGNPSSNVSVHATVSNVSNVPPSSTLHPISSVHVVQTIDRPIVSIPIPSSYVTTYHTMPPAGFAAYGGHSLPSPLWQAPRPLVYTADPPAPSLHSFPSSSHAIPYFPGVPPQSAVAYNPGVNLYNVPSSVAPIEPGRFAPSTLAPSTLAPSTFAPAQLATAQVATTHFVDNVPQAHPSTQLRFTGALPPRGASSQLGSPAIVCPVNPR